MKNNNVKLSLYNKDKVVIENFQKINEIQNEVIIIDNYKIVGTNLKICEINDYHIIVKGNILYINLEDDQK